MLRDAIAQLGAPWSSEHLSFNIAGGPDEPFFTSFMLPPRQTWEGVECATESIRSLAAILDGPLAIEPGVNYLRPRQEEMRDGQFVAAVAEAADCGILLDIHNIWTNELNGRQTMSDFLDDLPLERVWELHLAGGQEHAGYWLDAHCGAIPDEVLRVAEDVLRSAPNVRALIFELMPEYIARLGHDGLRRQLEAMHGLWGARRKLNRPPAPGSPAWRGVSRRERGPAGGDVRNWEDTLGALVIGLEPKGSLAHQLDADPGIGVIRVLVGEARAGMLTASLRLTVRLLLLHEGEPATRSLMEAFWKSAPPQPFAGDEGQAFAQYLRSMHAPLPCLEDVLSFELAVLAAAISGDATTVRFSSDPAELLGALADGRLPTEMVVGEYEFTVSPGSRNRSPA
jgi:hypothetical protein